MLLESLNVRCNTGPGNVIPILGILILKIGLLLYYSCITLSLSYYTFVLFLHCSFRVQKKLYSTSCFPFK